MMKKLLLIATVLVFVFGASTFAVAIDQRTKNGAFIYLIQMEPSEPVVGSNIVILTIRNASTGATVEGATVKMVPWMSMHGHGSPKETHIKEKGNGIYEASDVYYSMEGSWDLLITIQKGNVEDAASVIVDIKK